MRARQGCERARGQGKSSAGSMPDRLTSQETCSPGPMAGSDGGVQNQIEDTVKDPTLHARAGQPTGEIAENRTGCGQSILARRRNALAGVRSCLACQSIRDKQRVVAGGQPTRQQGKPAALRRAGAATLIVVSKHLQSLARGTRVGPLSDHQGPVIEGPVIVSGLLLSTLEPKVREPNRCEGTPSGDCVHPRAAAVLAGTNGTSLLQLVFAPKPIG